MAAEPPSEQQDDRRRDPVRVAVLDGLAALDPEAAADADAALAWMLDGAAVRTLTRLRLQAFLWYELPLKWVVPDEDRRAIVEALGRALEGCGLSRDAELCRSAVTSEILDAWVRDPSEGYDRYRRAASRSGVEPPDIDELVWADAMGPDESAALWSTAAALEVALDAGVFRPGRPGWRDVQRDVARTHLHRPRPELLGQSLLQTVHTERLARWVEEPGFAAAVSPARVELLGPIVNSLLAPVPPPRGVVTLVASVRSLVDTATAAGAKGLRLTASGRLPAAARRSVGEGADRAADLACRARLLRRRRGRLLAAGDVGSSTATGLWRRVAGALAEGPGFDAAVAELALAVLATDLVVGRVELERLVLVALTEAGWRRAGSGRPVAAAATSDALDETLRDLDLLGGLRGPRRGGDAAAEPVLRLSRAGRATALAALRARALAPVTAR